MKENTIIQELSTIEALSNELDFSDELEISEVLGKFITKEEALKLIKTSPKAWELFLDFPKEEQEKLVSFIQGGRGLPLLYDSFFKQIMDPEKHPQRLEQFLSTILNQKVHIKLVLPNEGTKLSENGSFVIMDIIVELEDRSIVDVEMQKIGYRFSGERSTCYISDLVMRQYNRIKSEKEKTFSFKDMKPVYLIILMEHSAKEFTKVSPAYIHRGFHSFDSGAKVNLLTNLLYISLDTFHSVVHNIDNLSDAWLTFLSSDKPEDILRLVKSYPEFKECYHDIAEFRRKPEELMSMHTDAFRIAEENTIKYMCEEQQKEIGELKEENGTLKDENGTLKEENGTLKDENGTLRKEMEQMRMEIERLRKNQCL